MLIEELVISRRTMIGSYWIRTKDLWFYRMMIFVGKEMRAAIRLQLISGRGSPEGSGRGAYDPILHISSFFPPMTVIQNLRA